MTPPSFSMGRSLLGFALAFLSISSFAQTTMNSSGNWSNAALWSNTIGDAITEDVTLANNTDATILSGTQYTIGTLTMNQNSKLTIKSTTGKLTLGASGNAKSATAANNTVITVEAGTTLEIWGSFTSSGNFTLKIDGTMIVHGAMAFAGNNTGLQVGNGGKLTVGGSMSAGMNTNFNNNGLITVGGAMAVGGGSNLNGSGKIGLGGACSGPSSWCNSSMLPVDLLWFRSKSNSNNIELAWSTATEKDVDFFALEKSIDGKEFFEIGKITAAGNSTTQRTYTFTDEKPTTGVSYFKLNEITIYGAKNELSVIKNIFDGKKEVTLSPNPLVKDQPLSLSFNFHTSQQHEVAVYDMRGMLMGRAVVSGSEGTVPLELSAGIYMVRVSSSEINSVQRIIVQ